MLAGLVEARDDVMWDWMHARNSCYRIFEMKSRLEIG